MSWMVLIDDFSRNVYVEETKTTATRYVIPILDKIFSFIGIPSVLKSDNGPPFNGHEYRDFLEYMGIKPRFITPENPKANGLVEHFMQPRWVKWCGVQ